MQLTPAILEAAYAYLAETAPFNEWNLPDAEDVDFEVVRSRKRQGRCHNGEGSGRYKIEISERYCSHSNTLLLIMAHEMVHVHEFKNGLDHYWVHGKVFKALAKEVCDAHGFDPGQF